jgi:hypothetical protein
MTQDQQLIQGMIENLIRTASRHKIVIAGFAFSVEPPMVINFGNCSDAGELRLYERLVSMCQEKREKGEAISTTVGEVN